YTNTATVTGTPTSGTAVTQTSNTVEVKVVPRPRVYVGYADSQHSSGGSAVPSPWKGSTGVTFEGCGYGGSDKCPTSGGVDVYDAGGIRIHAPSNASILVTHASAQVGPCSYNPWPGLSVTVAAGQTLILTQTDKL